MGKVLLIIFLLGSMSCKKSQSQSALNETPAVQTSAATYTASYDPRLDSIVVGCSSSNCFKDGQKQRIIEKVSGPEGSLLLFILQKKNVSETEWNSMQQDPNYKSYQSLSTKVFNLDKYLESTEASESDVKKMQILKGQLKAVSGSAKYTKFQAQLESAQYIARNWLDRLIQLRGIQLTANYQYSTPTKMHPPPDFGQYIAEQLSRLK